MRFRLNLEQLESICTPSTIDPYTPPDPYHPAPPADYSVDQGDGFYLALGLTDPWTDIHVR
jgi:hypothetical protein